MKSLYFKDELFACRTCHKLLYSSQINKQAVPHLYQLDRIEQQLQEKWQSNAAPPERPKGMHQKPYQNLCGLYIRTIFEIQQRGDQNISKYS